MTRRAESWRCCSSHSGVTRTSPPGRQGRLLFAYLVLNRRRLTSRDELIEAIWPRQLPIAAETGLNALISKLRAGRQLVSLAPLRESGYQVLMRALASQGNAAEALHVHARLCEVLRDELGISPCTATQVVYTQLLRA
jgi:DNA-binding SARP family transcriptional activator